MAKYYFRLILLFGSVVGLFLLVGMLLPRSYDFETSVTIEASPAEIFPYLNSLQQWQDWSQQWNEQEIEGLKIQYNGIESGSGAAQTWTEIRGSGKLWIVESVPDSSVAFDMKFENFPVMKSKITMSEGGGKTTVRWSSSGALPSGPMYGYMSPFYSTQMTHQYNASLAELKRVVETGEAPKGNEAAEEPPESN